MNERQREAISRVELRRRVEHLERALRRIAYEATDDRIGAIAELALLADARDPDTRADVDRLVARVERLSTTPSPRTEGPGC